MLCTAGGAVRPAAAQDAAPAAPPAARCDATSDPLLKLVNDQTEVGRVSFCFTDTQTLLTADLELQIATVQPGFLAGLQRRFSFIPGDAGVFPFRPVDVQKDVVRLTRYYARNGFPRALVDYAARLDSARNYASVVFVVGEGPPQLVSDVRFVGPGQSPAEDQLASELRADWMRFVSRPGLRPGDRYSETGLESLRGATRAWLRQRGYAFADAGAEATPDSTGLATSVRVKVTAGPRARYDSVTVAGAEGLAENVILRELPFRPGDRFDARELGEGQRELFGLGLFQLALVETVPDQPQDSTVAVRVRLRRGPSRVVQAFGGYFSDGGITGRASATHRNLLGGAQQLTAALEARTGIAGVSGRAVSGGPIRDISASVTLRQPYVYSRRLSATLQPSYRLRDDEIETGRTAEVLASLLYSRSSLRTVALGVAARDVDLSRGQGLRLLDPLSQIPATALTARTVVPSLDVTWGHLDNTLQPRSGVIVRPSLSGAAGDVSYSRGSISGSFLMPVGRRMGLSLRASTGILMPAGGTDIDAGRDYVLLRDRLFYAGGTADVRGWATSRLGPKALVITPDTTGFAETGQVRLRGNGDVNYTGTGGRGKASASAQLNLPLPLGPQWGANVFVDAGQVFRPSTVPTTLLLRASGNPADAQLAAILDREGGFRAGAGAGIQYLTPVGFVSVALGVKLNPSYLDLRNAANVYCGNDGVVVDRDNPDAPRCTGGYLDARKNSTTFDADGVDAHPILGRLQLHLSIGQSF